MAVAYRSSTSTTYTTRTNTTLTAPAGIQNGDILVVWFVVGAVGVAIPVTPPAGFNVASGFPHSTNDGAFIVNCYVWWKVASGESGNYTFTHVLADSQGWIGAYSGADTGAPLTPAPTYASGTGQTSTATGLTTARNSSAVIFVEHDWGDLTNDLTPPTGTTPTFTERTTGTIAIVYVADGVLSTAGATGNKTITNNNNVGFPWQASLIAIQPAATAVTFTQSAVAVDRLIVDKPSTTYWGCSCLAPNAGVDAELQGYVGLSRTALFAQLDSEYRTASGQTASPLMHIYHQFETTIPASYTPLVAAKYGQVINIKVDASTMSSGGYDSALASYIASFPNDGHRYWLYYWHEPENDPPFDTSAGAATWRAAVAQFAKVVLDNRGTRPMWPGQCIMAWTTQLANPGDETWYNAAPEMQALGVNLDEVMFTLDGYNTNLDDAANAGSQPDNLFTRGWTLAASWGFSRFAIAECGVDCGGNAQNRLDAQTWLERLVAHAGAYNLQHVTYLNSASGATDPVNGWFLYTAGQKAVFGNAAGALSVPGDILASTVFATTTFGAVVAEAPTLIASYAVASTASDQSSLITPSFTPAIGEVLVIKAVSANPSQILGTPTGGGWTYTQQIANAVTAYCRVMIWTAPITSVTTHTVTVTASVTAAWHSMVVERWRNATVAATPAVISGNSATGQPSATITTNLPGSIISWVNADYLAVDAVNRTYNTTDAIPVEESYVRVAGQYTVEYAYQIATLLGSETFGVTSPAGQKWDIAGVEIQSTLAAAQLYSSYNMGYTGTIIGSVSIPVADAATGADVRRTAATLGPVGESGAASDSLVITAIQLRLADAGIATDKQTIDGATTVANPIADTGIGSDSPNDILYYQSYQGVGYQPLPDPFQIDVQFGPTYTDNAVATDAIINGRSQLFVDTATAADARTIRGARQVTDTGTSPAATITASVQTRESDVGQAVDVLSIAGITSVDNPIADTAAAVDNRTTAAAPAPITDSGSAVDTLTVVIGVIAVTDGGIAADSTATTVTTSVRDQAVAVDFDYTSQLRPVADIGTAADRDRAAVQFTNTDAGVTADTTATTRISVISDGGIAADDLNNTAQLATIADAGVSTDSQYVAGTSTPTYFDTAVATQATSLTVATRGTDDGYSDDNASSVAVVQTIRDSGINAAVMSIDAFGGGPGGTVFATTTFPAATVSLPVTLSPATVFAVANISAATRSGPPIVINPTIVTIEEAIAALTLDTTIADVVIDGPLLTTLELTETLVQVTIPTGSVQAVVDTDTLVTVYVGW